MKNALGRKVLLLALVLTAGSLLAPWNGLSIGQEEKAARKSKGRLPSYYADIVTSEQRQKIYEIQLKYQDELRSLNEQLLALVKKQNDEIEAVLTPDQLAQLKKAQAEGAAKKKKAAAARKAAQADKAGSGN